MSVMPALRSPDLDPVVSTPFITKALRDWQSASIAGVPVMPYLFVALDGQSCALLSPVLDSLFRFYQAALERPLVVGDAGRLSDDEKLLLVLVSRPDLSGQKLDCPAGIARGFNCALCSARIMLAVALEGREPGSRPH
jgi:hypothetical protein